MAGEDTTPKPSVRRGPTWALGQAYGQDGQVVVDHT